MRRHSVFTALLVSVMLLDLQVEGDKVTLKLDGPAAYTAEKTPRLKDVLLVLPGVAGPGLLFKEGTGGVIGAVRARSFRLNGQQVTWVFIRLKGSPPYDIARVENDLEVTFKPTAAQ